jgi:hypothetical protein
MSLIRKSSVLVAVFLGMFAGSARAQEPIVAKVPFPFLVRGKEFPAGRYAITRKQSVIEVSGMDNSSVIFAMTNRATGFDPAGNQPALVFTRDENEYLLTQVWESSTDGLAVSGETITPKHGHAAAQPESIVLTYGLLSY